MARSPIARHEPRRVPTAFLRSISRYVWIQTASATFSRTELNIFRLRLLPCGGSLPLQLAVLVRRTRPPPGSFLRSLSRLWETRIHRQMTHNRTWGRLNYYWSRILRPTFPSEKTPENSSASFLGSPWHLWSGLGDAEMPGRAVEAADTPLVRQLCPRTQ